MVSLTRKSVFFLNPTKFFSVSQFQKRKRNFLKETPLWEFFFSFKNYFFFTQSIEKEVEDKRDEKNCLDFCLLLACLF